MSAVLQGLSPGLSVTVQFRALAPSAALRAQIGEHMARLARFDGRIRSCRVVVAAERQPHRSGDRYRVELHVLVAGKEIHVGPAHAHDPRHADPDAAVADAFAAARRCIETAAERRRAARPRRTAANGA